MEISSLLMNQLGSDSEQNQNKSHVKNEGFDSFMQMANNKQDVRNTSSSNQKNMKNDRNNDRNDISVNRKDKTVSNKPERKKPESRETNNNNKASVSDNPQDDNKEVNSTDSEMKTESKPTKEVSDAGESEAVLKVESESEAVSEDVISKLSSIIGIPVEKIQEILSTLNVKVEDLLKDNNLNQFMQMAFGLESQVELLSVPNIKEMFAEIKELSAELTNVKDLLAIDMDSAQVVKDMISTDENVQQSSVAQDNIDEMIATTNVESNVKEVKVAKDVKEVNDVKEVKLGNSDTSTLVDLVESEEGAAPLIKTTPITDDSNSTEEQIVINPVQAHQQQSNSFEFEQNGSEEDNNNANIPVSVANRQAATAQSVQTVARSNSAVPTNPQDVINQLLDKMKLEYKGDTTEIRMTLRPEHLGDVTLKVITENGIITAQFIAENQKVKEIIEAQFEQLKGALQQQGIEVSSLEVSVGQDKKEQLMEEFLRNQHKSSHRIRNIIDSIANQEMDEAVVQEPLTPDSSVEFTA